MLKKINVQSQNLKRVLMALYDIVVINLSFFLIMMVDGQQQYGILLERALPVTAIFIILLAVFRAYNSMWEYAGYKEALGIAGACVLGGLTSVAVDLVMANFGYAANNLEHGCFSVEFYIFGTFLTIFFVAGMRFTYRLVRRYFRYSDKKEADRRARVMIVGAGDMGMVMISEYEVGKKMFGRPVVAVDDDPEKLGKRLRGVPVKGTCNQIPEIVKKYDIDTIVLCIPSADMERQTEILRIAVATGCKLKISPSLQEMVEGNTDGRARDVDITDLLSRPEVTLNSEVCSYIKNQVVLVTGGGGSIGSELCRQISKYGPEKIIVFDIYENNAYMLKNQLDKQLNGKQEIIIRIGSVRDKIRLREVFEEFHPTIVFHAAAHKHVPLMEDSPKEAVKNNVFGTYNLAEIAVEYNVSRFVSISTDKAVNPTNVMGATKRVTEMIVQRFGRKCNNSTIFAAVRFGNVLGSSGSVIPIFSEQIKNGGPVTVTHPDITRYFMTIPEAAQLVAQAGGLAQGGEIFVLDMGEPVKIVSLAENLIRLSGYVPYTDIAIEFTGLRPGEKLYEELALEEEHDQRKKTANNKIFVTKPLDMDDEEFDNNLKALETADDEHIRKALKKLVPNFISFKKN